MYVIQSFPSRQCSGSLNISTGYTLNCIRYLTSSNPISVINVSHTLFEPANPPADYKRNVDRATTSTLALPNDITASLTCDMQQPLIWGFIPRLPKLTVLVECEGGKLDMFNFVMPGFFHSITVTPKDLPSRKEKAYTFREGDPYSGKEWWDTYRYQLEAFVNRVKGRETQTWITKEDSVGNMEWVEKIYAEVCWSPFPLEIVDDPNDLCRRGLDLVPSPRIFAIQSK